MATEFAPLPPLPDIDQVPPYGEGDDVIFKEIREVLERHDALTRFGVTLLHQHFPMADDEILLEHIDRENRVLTSRPVKIEQTEESAETSWRLDDPTGAKRCETQCKKGRNSEGEEYHYSAHYTVS